jgi:glycosyltransferase involved in cell wall biosynthesis
VRILQVSNFYPPYWVGGYEQLAGWVGTGLRKRGHEVEVLTGRGPAFHAHPFIRGELDLDLGSLWETYFTTGIAQGDGLREGLRNHVFNRRNFEACRRAIGRFRPDLVSFWNPAFVTFSPLLAARLASVPAVAHLCDTTANIFRNPHPPRFPDGYRPLARAGVDLLLRCSRPARIVVPSAFLRDRFVTTEGLPPSRIAVVHGPVEPSMSRSAPPSRERRQATRVLFLGTLIPEKGPDVLIEAFRRALGARPDLMLSLVGGGPEPYVERLRSLAQGLPVRFHGRVGLEGVIEAYRSHDVLAFPSVWDEPFAVVPLEAMSMGLAVIASTAGGTPEAVVHEQTGLLFPRGDIEALSRAILRLAADRELAGSLAAAGQRWARENQGFDVFMDRVLRIYEDAARGGGA